MSDLSFMAVSISILAGAIFMVSFMSARMMGHSPIDCIVGAIMESAIVSFFALPLAYLICRVVP